jgi:hypothetical protein
MALRIPYLRDTITTELVQLGTYIKLTTPDGVFLAQANANTLGYQTCMFKKLWTEDHTPVPDGYELLKRWLRDGYQYYTNRLSARHHFVMCPIPTESLVPYWRVWPVYYTGRPFIMREGRFLRNAEFKGDPALAEQQGILTTHSTLFIYAKLALRLDESSESELVFHALEEMGLVHDDSDRDTSITYIMNLYNIPARIRSTVYAAYAFTDIKTVVDAMAPL